MVRNYEVLLNAHLDLVSFLRVGISPLKISVLKINDFH